MNNLIPKPLDFVEKNGNAYISSNTAVGGDFSEMIELATGKLRCFPNGIINRLTFKKVDGYEEEEYSIDCQDIDIVISASTCVGARYGFVTLVSLFDKKNSMRACTVHDKPTYAYRGFMLDCARHFWDVCTIKKYLDYMAFLKLNVFHWHLTDDQGWRAEIKKYPLLTSKGTTRKSTGLCCAGNARGTEPHDNKEYGRDLFYTQEQMVDVVAYAHRRNIQVVPEVDMPGHMVSAIACYPELSCSGRPTEVGHRFGVHENILCAGRDEVMTFVKDVIDELCTIFPSKYFHIGGDEVPKTNWKSCPRCQARIKELGLKNEEALQGWFNVQISEYLKSKGKTLIGWNEILTAASMLDKQNTVAQWWTKSAGNELEKSWAQQGGKLLLTQHAYVYADHPYAARPLKKTYSYGASKVRIPESSILGIEMPQWTEYIRTKTHLDFNTVARLAAIAERGWSDGNARDYDDFERRLEANRRIIGDIGLTLCEQRCYRGKTMSALGAMLGGGMSKWAHDPLFEL